MKTILRDLSRNADDRLEQWTRDTAMRFEAANLPESEAISVVVTTLLGRSIQMVKWLGMSRGDFLILVQKAYDQIPEETPKGRGRGIL